MSQITQPKLKPTQWFAHIAAWRVSGQTRSAYCLQQGLKVYTFGYWVEQQRDQVTENGSLTLIPA